MPKRLFRGVAVFSAILLAVPPPTAFAQPKLPASTEAAATEFSVAQLDAMLAPIALYPDELLAQLLMASAYPLQVIAASRWLATGDNKNLKGDALSKALESQNWDPSVKSLVPFPQIIAMMNDKLEWTQQLGYAVVNQQAAVLDSIQRLRKQAQKAGSLKTSPQQRVETPDEAVDHRTRKLRSRLGAGVPTGQCLWRLAVSRHAAGLFAAAAGVLPGGLRAGLCLGHRDRLRGRGRGDGRVMGLGKRGLGQR